MGGGPRWRRITNWRQRGDVSFLTPLFSGYPILPQGLLLSLLAAGWAGASEAPGESSSWLERQPGDLSEREL